MSVERLNYFYENENGNIPDDLFALCLGMDGLFENYPEGKKARLVLSGQDSGRLESAIERLSKYPVDMLTGTEKFAKKTDDIYILKIKCESNPRLYFTNYFDGKYVFLHGLKKKQYDEDPNDLDIAEQRLEELKVRDEE